MKKKKIAIIVTIIMMAIGFAAVSSILYINGTIFIGQDDYFRVYYSAASMTPMKTGAKIERQDDLTNLVFNTGPMNELGEEVVVDYTIKNDSRRYAAEVTINCTGNGGSEYLSVTNKVANRDITTITDANPLYLEADGERDGKIVVKLIKSYAEETGIDVPITCEINATGVKSIPVPTNPPAMLLSEKIISKKNETNEYNDETKGEVFEFAHEATDKLVANTDYRYIGDEPNNYIDFNGETWRIIGVVPTDDGTGAIRNRVKIMRERPLDDRPTANNIGNILNSESETGYYASLTEDAKKIVSEVDFYGISTYTNKSSSTADAKYAYERGSTRNTINKKISLLYLSDYQYTFAYGANDTCYPTATDSSCSNGTATMSWMYKNVSDYSYYSEWTSEYYYYDLMSINNGKISSSSTYHPYGGYLSYYVRPVLYLDADLKYFGGDGSEESPYATSGTPSEPEVEPEPIVINGYTCKRATSLHNDGVHTYGQIGTSGTLKSGDAFDCDVNGDGLYSEAIERFYYVTDLNSNTAVLVYYNNTKSGTADSMKPIIYSENVSNYQGPKEVKKMLPTIYQWGTKVYSNPRQLTTDSGETEIHSNLLYTLGTYDYETSAARLLTVQEVNAACGISTIWNSIEYVSEEIPTKCSYLLENTKYADSSLLKGYWLENPYRSSIYNSMVIDSEQKKSVNASTSNSTDYGARPVIEVKKSDISY